MEGNGKKFAEFQGLSADGKLEYLYMELSSIRTSLEKLEGKVGFTTALYGFIGGAVPVLILVGIKYITG